MDAGDELARRGQALLATSVASTVLAIGTCGLRFMARRQAKKRLWWDDYSAMVATVMAFISMTLTSLLATSRAPRALRYTHLSRPWLMLATTLAQVSASLFLLRALGPRRPWNVFLGALVLLLALVSLASAVASGLVCRPLEKLWDGAAEGECFAEGAELGIAYFQGGFAVFVFFSLATFPALVVRSVLEVARWPFRVLSGSMLLCAIFSVSRTYKVSKIGPRGSFNGAVLLAATFDVLAQNLAIMAANILPLGTHPTATGSLDLGSDSAPWSPETRPIFVIEGPNNSPEHLSAAQSSPVTPSRLTTALSRYTEDRPFSALSLRPDTPSISHSGTKISAGGPLPSGVDEGLLRGGIVRTVEVEVVEESVDDSVCRDVALGGWRDIILGGPR